eukprot:jgi/Tetstr1/446191/TSEL_003591.t1
MASGIGEVRLYHNTANTIPVGVYDDITSQFTVGSTSDAANLVKGGLSPGTQYWFWVEVIDVAGNESAILPLGNIITAGVTSSPADELPEKMQRELAQYVERFNEWKKMCNTMNRLDRTMKEYMIENKIDYIEDEGVQLSMAHPKRWMLDQSLIDDIDQYKVEKKINILTVDIDDDKVAAKRARVEQETANSEA